MSEARRRSAKKLRLVDLIFRALNSQGMVPVMGQRVVADPERGLATAVDLVCSRRGALVLVELKTGYSGNRTLAAKQDGRSANMGGPFRSAHDTILNRHFAQLTATTALFVRETSTLQRLSGLGLKGVESVLLYATNDGVEIHELPEWWHRRGERLLTALL
jgi:hypothetical protein